MLYRTYGRTGKKISAVAFGGMRFPKPEDIDASAELVLYAHKQGINYFDTAPGYCNDKSEDIMGRAFKSMPRDSYYCSTKSGTASGEEMRKSIERSLKRLNVSYLDFFHIWCLIQPHELPERVKGGAVAAALKAKEEGLVRHVVVSTHLNGKDCTKVLESGYFEGLTVGYNILNFPFREEGLASALRLGMGVVTMNPLGGGLIPRNAQRLDFLRSKQDRSVVDAALRFNVSQPAITAALVGFASTQEIDQAVAAMTDFTPYPAQHIAYLKTQIGAGFDGFCTGCGYCLPCPSSVAIPKMMDAFNHKILAEGDPDTETRNRLSWHWGLSPDEAAACTQCGQCEESCTQHLDIRQRMQYIASLIKKA